MCLFPSSIHASMYLLKHLFSSTSSPLPSSSSSSSSSIDPLLSKYTIRLHTSIPSSSFIMDKLYPDRNNVRRKAFADLTQLAVKGEETTTAADGMVVVLWSTTSETLVISSVCLQVCLFKIFRTFFVFLSLHFCLFLSSSSTLHTSLQYCSFAGDGSTREASPGVVCSCSWVSCNHWCYSSFQSLGQTEGAAPGEGNRERRWERLIAQ